MFETNQFTSLPCRPISASFKISKVEFYPLNISCEKYGININKPTGCGTKFHQNQLKNFVTKYVQKVLISHTSYNWELEWQSRSSNLISKCGVQRSLSSYQAWKRLVCKCMPIFFFFLNGGGGGSEIMQVRFSSLNTGIGEDKMIVRFIRPTSLNDRSNSIQICSILCEITDTEVFAFARPLTLNKGQHK